MGKIRKNRYLARFSKKSLKTIIFATFETIILDDFQDSKKPKFFELANGASLQNVFALAN